VISGEFEGDGSVATRRVLFSHEELRLLVVRPSVGVTAPPGAASFGPRRVAGLSRALDSPWKRLLPAKDLVDSAAVEVGCLADLCQRKSGLSRPLEALAALLSNVLQLPFGALDLALDALYLCPRLLSCLVRHRHGDYSPVGQPWK
jgi:hypothetical protein